ncbi:hypothetical protein L8106_07821 [Lyngbya sp. PCC 8106]|nr:hypothetical protein L8106_07821 [Lyngbya sp. PCC 8106]
MIMLESVYILGAVATFVVSLSTFIGDQSTPKTHGMSWLILLEATLFWPIVLPFACLERLLS